jgi:predicted transcriptional regulator
VRKAAAPREIPPPLEVECLKALWKLGECSVKDVRAELAPRRDLAYTTVMTLLDRLARKGAVSRRKTGRLFLYTAVLPEDLLRGLAVKELVDSLFGSSPEALLEFLSAGPGRAETASGQKRLDTVLL